MEKEEILELFKKQGFLTADVVSLKKSLSFNTYKAQVWSENFGGMEFLKNHLKLKDPKEQQFKTALVGLYPYYPETDELKSNLKVALYAKEKDYHYKINDKLKCITEDLQKAFPNHNFSHSVDSAPVLERDLAYRAGLGWMGKNTCIINKEYGSLFYIAEILTDYETRPLKKTLQTDHCGNCTRCIDACPTGALTPRKLTVDKCISYRNIEDKDTSPSTLNKKLDSWFFGCDICQTVCPWNEKNHGKEEMNELNKPFKITKEAVEEIKSILLESNNKLLKTYRDFPLSRARGTGLKRNALKLIHENQITELKDFLNDLEVSEQLRDLKNKVIKSLVE